MNKIFPILLLLSFNTTLLAQSSAIYLPLNIKKAYAKNTRSYDGKPGPEYWQNKADYTIEITLDPESGLLSGKEQIKYFNHSPDSLWEVVIHLFPNIYKIGNSREFVIDSSDASPGIILEEILVNGEQIEINETGQSIEYLHNDIQVYLDKPLHPGKSLKFNIKWYYYVNKKSHMRTGMVDSTSYFIAYFFPRIAVYDDIDGWNYHKYSGIAEFYNDFGSFDVSITVPGNQIVWATGTLQNPKDVLSETYLQKYLTAKTADTIISIIDSTDYFISGKTRSPEMNTWNFSAENVTDFAFATSDHYLWDATSLIVDQKTNQRVLIEAAYNINSNDFYDVAAISRQSIDYMSNEFPGVPFPYFNMTVFNGLDEMEYPMMVNDKTVYSKSYLIKLTSHEISHSYFPFYMGINETKYGWMDEGWACFIEYQVCKHLDSEENANIFYMSSYKQMQGDELDLPIISPSIYLKRPVYHLNTYAKSATFLFILKNLLGSARFGVIVREFIERWNGKHPTPYDFFFSIEDLSKQDLSWLIEPWFFEFGYVDLRIASVNQTDDGYEIDIEKIGRYPAPVNLKITYDDESIAWEHESVSIWAEGRSGFRILHRTMKKIYSVELMDPIVPDADRSNNYIEID